MCSVATGPSKDSFQCLYRLGSIRKSTTTRAPSPMTSPLAEDHPQHLGDPGAHVLPAVRGAAVEVGAVAGPEHVAVAVVLQGHLALDDVEELHLPRLDDHLVRLHAPRPRPERGHHRPDLTLEEPRPQHVPLLGGPVEGDHRVVGLPAYQEPPRRGRLEEGADGHAESGGQLAEGGERRGQAPRLDLRQHARGEAGLLGELTLLQRPLGAEGLDPLAEGGHASASSGRPASRRSARATYTRTIFFRYGCVRSVLSSGLAGRYAASATRSISSGVRRSPTSRRAASAA